MRTPVTESVDDATATLADRFRAVRDLTETLSAPLSAEDQVVQSMPDVSPTKWHRAHTTWFFETFLLQPNIERYTPVHESYGYLFNSYYEAVGDRHPRAERGLITRPNNDEVRDYRATVDAAMHDLLDSPAADDPALVELVVLGLHHEQQHQELLLMDAKHVLSRNLHAPAYVEQLAAIPGVVDPLGWADHAGAIECVGVDADARFAFDNEGPRHEVLLHPHRLADRPVTNGEWLEFMADGGYEHAGHWLSAGWAAVNAEGWDSPLYWRRTGDGWAVHTLGGVFPIDPAEPVVHISYFEADAFARWAGHRLPTEFEWEAHAARREVEGNLLSSGRLHPAPAGGRGVGVRQLFGDVWEWTSSAYAPYPRYRPAEGAVGEYNGKFMIDQQVLRGGSCVTPAGHVRASYRNFFPTDARWAFSGLRLAADLEPGVL